jgi:S-methylmethionine-dependent homocysteine/selenocysteine methylase
MAITPAEALRARLGGDGAPLLLDGATGAQLHARGMPTPAPLWSAAALLERRGLGLLRLIAGEYIRAGAEILTTNTFRTHQRNLDAGRSPLGADDLNRRAVRVLREAIKEEGAEGRVWVAGSITTLEDCYRPDLVPSDAECETEHAAAAGSLGEAGVDLLLLETFNTVRESAIATRCAAAVDVPLLSCVVCGDDGRLLSGESVAQWAQAVAPLLPDAMGINCASLAGMELALTDLEQSAPQMPRVAYGNIGEELPSGAWDSSDCPPDQYAAHAARWHEAGARVIGGCCGTTPAHIKATAAALRG